MLNRLLLLLPVALSCPHGSLLSCTSILLLIGRQMGHHGGLYNSVVENRAVLLLVYKIQQNLKESVDRFSIV